MAIYDDGLSFNFEEKTSMIKKFLKKLKMLIIVVFVILLTYGAIKILISSTGDAFSWSWMMSSFDEKIKTENVKQIEMYGNNGRIYPFDYELKNGEIIECFALATTSGSSSFCFYNKK